ncbi:unnamed protein product [Bursaphelenchus xylophilus]|uniref:(pine wood nematode) hypothetical protein n=1 Tax=Bursaphelenchus xylophilus TaxID=6326 RepID=A0A1I7S6P4_BURXY|nr:unnamed protein product [Bursaphelenchus xylophilus]CAG9120644.1 unnamed protein product [Bursaphelenchus xylophilus]
MPTFGPDGRCLIKGATVTAASPRPSRYPNLERQRYNRSCDWSPPGSLHQDFSQVNKSANPIAQVGFQYRIYTSRNR